MSPSLGVARTGQAAAHIPALDGLRLVCCLAVVVGHAAWGPLLARLASFGLSWLLGPAFTVPFRGPADARFFTTTLGAYALFVGNWIEAPLPAPLEVLWSVCIEEQFYVLFLRCSRSARRRAPL